METQNRIAELLREHKTYTQIADILNKEGKQTVTGTPFKLHSVVYYAKKLRRKKAPAQGASFQAGLTRVRGITKWKVLEEIDKCEDFSHEDKKKIMSFILRI